MTASEDGGCGQVFDEVGFGGSAPDQGPTGGWYIGHGDVGDVGSGVVAGGVGVHRGDGLARRYEQYQVLEVGGVGGAEDGAAAGGEVRNGGGGPVVGGRLTGSDGGTPKTP